MKSQEELLADLLDHLQLNADALKLMVTSAEVLLETLRPLVTALGEFAELWRAAFEDEQA